MRWLARYWFPRLRRNRYASSRPSRKTRLPRRLIPLMLTFKTGSGQLSDGKISRGRITYARDLANEVMQVGQLLGDPRSTGLGLWLLAAVAILSESYTEALACSEKALGTVVTPYDRLAALASKATALVMLRRIEEALPLLEEHRRLCLTGGFLSSLTLTDPFIGICKILQGKIGAGIQAYRNRNFEERG